MSYRPPLHSAHGAGLWRPFLRWMLVQHPGMPLPIQFMPMMPGVMIDLLLRLLGCLIGGFGLLGSLGRRLCAESLKLLRITIYSCANAPAGPIVNRPEICMRAGLSTRCRCIEFLDTGRWGYWTDDRLPR